MKNFLLFIISIFYATTSYAQNTREKYIEYRMDEFKWLIQYELERFVSHTRKTSSKRGEHTTYTLYISKIDSGDVVIDFSVESIFNLKNNDLITFQYGFIYMDEIFVVDCDDSRFKKFFDFVELIKVDKDDESDPMMMKIEEKYLSGVVQTGQDKLLNTVITLKEVYSTLYFDCPDSIMSEKSIYRNFENKYQLILKLEKEE